MTFVSVIVALDFLQCLLSLNHELFL